VLADYTAIGARADGACVDRDGCLWQAIFAGSRIVRYRPDGTIDRTISLPVTNPTCLCFGGQDLKTLYVTSATKFLSQQQRAAEPLAGSLLAIEGVGQGLPENRFG
jgi:sugar lactone lactonase YvrE